MLYQHIVGDSAKPRIYEQFVNTADLHSTDFTGGRENLIF